MVQQVKTARPGLKICGVTNERDAGLCLALGVDYVGFNLHPGSKRYLSAAAAATVWANAIRNHGDKPVTTAPVGVFVGATAEVLTEALAAFPALVAVQYHGGEAVATLAEQAPLRAGRAAWKAVAVHGPGDVAAAAGCGAEAALVLFDGVAAGSGQPFDWRFLAAYTGVAPFGVAGGIRPGTLAALAHVRPALVDLCSGVEERPGMKSPELLQALWREHLATW